MCVCACEFTLVSVCKCTCTLYIHVCMYLRYGCVCYLYIKGILHVGVCVHEVSQMYDLYGDGWSIRR